MEKEKELKEKLSYIEWETNTQQRNKNETVTAIAVKRIWYAKRSYATYRNVQVETTVGGENRISLCTLLVLWLLHRITEQLYFYIGLKHHYGEYGFTMRFSSSLSTSSFRVKCHELLVKLWIEMSLKLERSSCNAIWWKPSVFWPS